MVHMPVRRRTALDGWLPALALVMMGVTLLLTYASDLLASFRGSSLAYLGWALLALSALAGVTVLSGSVARWRLVLRNASFVGGMLVMALAIVLAVWAAHMFPW